MQKDEARLVTLAIFRVILEEHNGYTKEQIKADKLDEECVGAEVFTRIEDIIKKIPTRKKIQKTK